MVSTKEGMPNRATYRAARDNRLNLTILAELASHSRPIGTG